MGHSDVSAVANATLTIEWSLAALADLQRFAVFLHQRDQKLASIVAKAIIEKTNLIAYQPLMGRERERGIRQIVIHVLKASYDLRYNVDDERVVILRIFHTREDRD